MRGMALVAALTSLAVAAPAALADGGTVAFDDPCGDSHGYVYYDDQRYDLPPTERTPRFDLNRVTVSPTANGVSVRFDMCGAIGETDGLSGFRGFYVGLPDGCTLGIGEDEPALPTLARHVHMFKSCLPADPGSNWPLPDESDQRFDIDIPQATVDGSSMTIEVDRTGLTGEAAAALALGTQWQHLGAASAENPTTFGGGFASSTDESGNTTDEHNFGDNIPTGLDFARTVETFTVS